MSTVFVLCTLSLIVSAAHLWQVTAGSRATHRAMARKVVQL